MQLSILHLTTMLFNLNIRNHFTAQVTEHWHKLPRQAVVSLSWRSSKATWVWAWAPCSGWLCLSLDQVGSRGPCQPQPLGDNRTVIKAQWPFHLTDSQKPKRSKALFIFHCALNERICNSFSLIHSEIKVRLFSRTSVSYYKGHV